MASDVQYSPTTWVTGSAPGISAAQLNRIESGVDSVAAQFSSHNGGSATSDHPQATTSQRGFMSAADKSRLNGIEAGATGDQSAAEILTAIKTVDGPGSSLNADLLDGLQGSAYTLDSAFSSHDGGTATSDHPQATTSTRGFMSSTDKSKLNNIENNAKNDQTAAQILAALLTVDGSGSALDADLLDGLQGSAFARSDTTDNVVRLRFGSGALAAPSMSFTHQTGTGFSYDTTGDFLRASVAGTEIVRIQDTGAVKIPQSATTGYEFINGTVKLRSENNTFKISVDNTTRVTVGILSLDCNTTDRLTLGRSGARWSEVWATDGTINPSDARAKESIVNLVLGLDFVKAVRKISWVWPGRTRPHAGFDAADVRTVLTTLGVTDFGGYIDPAVNGYTPPSPTDTDPPPTGWDNLALRPTEFIAPAYVAISELATRLEVLEAAALSNGDDE